MYLHTQTPNFQILTSRIGRERHQAFASMQLPKPQGEQITHQNSQQWKSTRKYLPFSTWKVPRDGPWGKITACFPRRRFLACGFTGAASLHGCQRRAWEHNKLGLLLSLASRRGRDRRGRRRSATIHPNELSRRNVCKMWPFVPTPSGGRWTWGPAWKVRLRRRSGLPNFLARQSPQSKLLAYHNNDNNHNHNNNNNTHNTTNTNNNDDNNVGWLRNKLLQITSWNLEALEETLHRVPNRSGCLPDCS